MTTPPEEELEPPAPTHWEADVVAADGGTVHLRPIRWLDAEALVAFHGGLSQRTRYLRYFSAYPRIPERDLLRFTHVDHFLRVALVAELAGEIIAVGRYEGVAGSDTAEVAFVVADAHQGRGIGSVLLEHLAAAARERGIARFEAVVLAENAGMMGVFRDAGYEISRHMESGEVTLIFPLAETATTASVTRDREQRAEARSIQRLLRPATVAVIGASTDPAKIGHAVLDNLLRMGFTGEVYPVHPSATDVLGRRAYASVRDLPDDVGLAVIAVPGASVAEVVRDCADRGVRGLVVLSGGYGERGDDAERDRGRAAQRELVGAARAHGMRVVGPNCLGVVNTASDVRLNASLAPLPPLTGRAGFFCQSGALGVAILGEAARRGLGVSTFVSAGNRADVSGNDLLQYWAGDDATDVVLMYLESFGNPRKFTRLARRLGRSKPIVAVKSGLARGLPAAGAAVMGTELPDDAVRALFEASGVIRVETLGDLFDVALVLTTQPLPGGGRLAIVGNSTALAVLAGNAADAEGLTVTRLDDVGVDAGPQEFRVALREALAADDVDAAVVVYVPPLLRGSGADTAASVRAEAAASGKPVVSTFLGFDGVPAELAGEGLGAPPPGSVPSYPSPERAIRALARVVRYASWRARPVGSVPDVELDVDVLRAVATAALAEAPAGRDLTEAEAEALLAAAGIAVTRELPADVVEVVCGVREDPSFGALISFAVGGVASELLGDRAYAAVPLTSAEAMELIAAPRAAPLLSGYAGTPSCDQQALADLVLRLSALADALPELQQARLRAYAAPIGVFVHEVTAAVAPAAARLDSGPRRLRGL